MSHVVCTTIMGNPIFCRIVGLT